MDAYANDARIADLDSALPRLAARERGPALAELAWYLREADTRRARSLALEARSLLAVPEPGPEATRALARADLTLAECALLCRDVEAASAGASTARQAFESIEDSAGCADACLLQARIARVRRDEGAEQASAAAARRAAEASGDRSRQALAAIAFATQGSRAPDPAALAAWAEASPAAACYVRYLEGRAHVGEGEFERAVEALSRASAEAQRLGMAELALESELAIARTLGALSDLPGALETAEPVLEAARERGWRGLLAAATASVCGWLLDLSQGARALELLHEARASLAALTPPRADAALECLLGEAELASGRPALATAALSGALALLREQGAAAEIPRALALEARALAQCGRIDDAHERAMQALAQARRVDAPAAEIEALLALAEIDAGHPSGERTPRSAIAFLRHAAEIADELGDGARKAAILARAARLHEANGDGRAALAAERSAHAECANEARRGAEGAAIAARAHRIRERQRLADAHARALHEAHARHAADLARAFETVDRTRALAHDVAQCPDPATLLECLERRLAEIADMSFVALFVFDASRQGLARYAREAGRAIPMRHVAAGDLEPYAARAARERRELLVELESARGGEGREARDASTLWFGPVALGERVLGVLTVQSRHAHAYGERERIVFRSASGHAALALDNAHVRESLRAERALRIETEERVRRAATVDGLTGLATRGYFLALARERLERARRDGGPCGFIVADVDAFKAINDTRGWEGGDRVLAAISAVIAQCERADDAAGRIGAEEFGLLLPGASLEVTVAVAERIRLAVEALRVACDGRPVPVTLSFGCSALGDARAEMGNRPAQETLERLVREADAALYEAQGTGGNRTIAWPAYQALRALRTGPGDSAASELSVILGDPAA